MRFFNILLLVIAGLVTVLTLTSAKPIVAAVKSTPARDIEWVGPPPSAPIQVCCTPGCRSCVNSSCLNTGCTFLVPWTSCCSLDVARKRSANAEVEVYNQQGELVTWVDAGQINEREVEMVGPPGVVAERLCCTSDCETCFGSCYPVGCPIVPWTTCCVHPIPSKRDGNHEARDQKRELVKSIDVLGPLSARDVDWAGPPPPPPVQLCCSIGCESCGDASCRGDTGLCSPFHSCCAIEFARKRSDGAVEAYNQKGELVQWVSPAVGPFPPRSVEEQISS